MSAPGPGSEHDDGEELDMMMMMHQTDEEHEE